MPKKKSTVRSVAKKTITAEENQKDKEVQVPPRDFVFFFVGGAADKEAYYFQKATNLVDFARLKLIENLTAKYLLDRVDLENNKTYHLDYSNAKGEVNIKNYFVDKIK